MDLANIKALVAALPAEEWTLVERGPYGRVVIAGYSSNDVGPVSLEVARFIAAARQAVPELVAEVERLDSVGTDIRERLRHAEALIGEILKLNHHLTGRAEFLTAGHANRLRAFLQLLPMEEKD